MICTVRIGFFILGCNGTVFKLSWCSDSVLRRKITSKQLFINSVCSTEEGAHKNDERFNYLWKKVRVRDFCSFLGSKITATIWLIIMLTCVNLNVFNFFTFWFTNFVLFYQFDYSWSFGYFAYDLESSLVLRSDNSSILKWKVTKVNFVASKWTWFSTFELVQLD